MNCLSDVDNIYFPVITGLSISGLYLGSRFKLFSYFKNINDEQGILFPSLFFIASPFISVHIFTLLKNGVFFEVLRSLTPVVSVLTFFLGQVYERKRQEREQEKKERVFIEKIVDLLDDLNFRLGSLSDIEPELIKDPDFNTLQSSTSITQEIRNFFSIINPDEVRQKINLVLKNDLFFSIKYRHNIKLYFQKVVKFINKIGSEDTISSNVQPSPCYPNLIIWKNVNELIIEGSEYAMLLIKDIKDIIENEYQLQNYIKRLQNNEHILREFVEYEKIKIEQTLNQEQDGTILEQKYSYLQTKVKYVEYIIKYIEHVLKKVDRD